MIQFSGVTGCASDSAGQSNSNSVCKILSLKKYQKNYYSGEGIGDNLFTEALTKT